MNAKRRMTFAAVASIALAWPLAPDAGLAAGKVRTPAEIRAAAQALKEGDVAWRNIEWQTCLIDGLKQSGAERKPLILWIFIDRPIDDERC